MHYRIHFEVSTNEVEPGKPSYIRAWSDEPLPIRPHVGDRLVFGDYTSVVVRQVILHLDTQTAGVNAEPIITDRARMDRIKRDIDRCGWESCEEYPEGTRP
jgi:hypothetical protein